MDKIAWGKFAHYHYDEADLDQLTTFNGRGVYGRLCRNPPFASCKPAGQQRAPFKTLGRPKSDPKSRLSLRGLISAVS